MVAVLLLTSKRLRTCRRWAFSIRLYTFGSNDFIELNRYTPLMQGQPENSCSLCEGRMSFAGGRLSAIVLVALCFCFASAGAQVSASLSGRVTDKSGAA